MASQEAVERRRINRHLRNKQRAQQRQQQLARDELAEDPWRNIRRRRIDPQRHHPIHDNPLYWQARRCEWDALSESLRPTLEPFGLLRADPTQTAFWTWWTGLHYESRATLVELSRGLHEPGERGGDEGDPYELLDQLRQRFPDAPLQPVAA